MQNGTGIIEKVIDGKNTRIDGRKATIRAEVPEIEQHEYLVPEKIIYTNPIGLLNGKTLPSFSLIRFGKVKNFIDGVYAAVEERIAEKGHGLSRKDFLSNLETALSGDAKNYIMAAKKGTTMDDPAISIPQGFYDWNKELREAYKQIKITARNPSFFMGEEDDNADKLIMGEIREAINSSRKLKEPYLRILDLYSKMTEKHENTPSLFPAAILPDQEFFKQLSYETKSDLLEGLGKLLVKAVREGKVKFFPNENSGLYIRQMHEIVPLVKRDSPEFEKYIVNGKYGEILDKEFISQWAGTRHTHVGHTSFGTAMLGCCIDREEPIIITPELRIEPFATPYERMRLSIGFLEDTIREYLPEVMDRKRLLNNGGRKKEEIGDEFVEMKLLLKGLELISKDSLHMEYKESDALKAATKAMNWIKNIKNDADLDRNMAIFVPIIRTTSGEREVCYIDAGFKTIDVDVSYQIKPEVKVTGWLGDSAGYLFSGERYQFPVLVHREVRVPYQKLINDRKLRDMLNGSFTETELDIVVRKLERG